MSNIRHDIDQDDVRASIEESNARDYKHHQYAIKEYEERYVILGLTNNKILKNESFLTPKEYASREYDSHIRFNSINLKYYSTVRVIERMDGGDKPFILVYGDVDDATVRHGTGGFESYEEAKSWFMGGGR